MAWTNLGNQALHRVRTIVYGANYNPNFDAFGGFTYGQHYPNGVRINFENAIIQHVIQNAPTDNGQPPWYTCAYCDWEYPRNRCQIDHVIPWHVYSQQMTTNNPLANALALQVWAGCNDPANLVVACQPCNGAKGNQVLVGVAMNAFITNRQNLANAQQGF